MDEDEPLADEGGALIAKEKDPEANQSAAGKQQKWGLLTSICKVNTISCLHSMLSPDTAILYGSAGAATLHLPQLPMDQALMRIERRYVPSERLHPDVHEDARTAKSCPQSSYVLGAGAEEARAY